MGSIQEIHQRVNNKFKKQIKIKNLDKVERRKIITGSKCMQTNLHRHSAFSILDPI